jgi:uncharacterized protein YjdB
MNMTSRAGAFLRAFVVLSFVAATMGCSNGGGGGGHAGNGGHAGGGMAGNGTAGNGAAGNGTAGNGTGGSGTAGMGGNAGDGTAGMAGNAGNGTAGTGGMGPATLSSIAITPTNMSIAKGTTQQFTATATYSDATTKDITATATWASSMTATATISPAGLATAVAPGSTMITATSGGVMGSTMLTVTGSTLVSIAVTPATPSIAKGTTQQFTATGTFKDAANNMTTQDLTTMVTWASGTTATATISTGGLATAVAQGTSTITATSGGVMGSTTLTVNPATLVSIAVTTTTASIAKGTTATFVATGTFSDATTQDLTTQVTWSSATPATATIAATGVATSVGKGTTVISAALSGKTGMLTLTVTDATLVSVSVSAELPVPTATPAIAHNTKVQFDAIGIFSDQSKQDLTDTVTWASSTNVVTISNAAGTKGLATAGNNAGMSVISATLPAAGGAPAVTGMVTLVVTNQNLVSIVVTPAAQTIAKGTTQQFTAIGFFQDASKQDLTETATWSSTNVGNATISNVAGTKGLAKGAAVGGTTITAAIGTINDTATLTVSAAVLQTIAISPAAPNVALGTTLTLGAEGTFSDGSKQDVTTAVAWSSATTTVATISNAAGTNGTVTPVAKGTSVITATFTIAQNQTVSGMVTLTVSNALLKSIAVTAATSTTLEKGATQQLTATGTFTDNTTADLTKMVTWTTDKAAVATVSNTAATAGLVTAVATGTVNISATSTAPSMSGQPVVGTLGLTVNDGKLVSIAVTPATPTIAPGTKLQFVATGTFDDGAKLDITSSVNWASDTVAAATVDNAGLATGVAKGMAKITASQGTTAQNTISGSTTLNVSMATLMAIVVQPPNATIANGTTVQFKATGFFDDTSTQDLTDTATWTSSMPTIATISNDPASNGLATGKAQSATPTNITASVLIGGVTVTSAAVPLTVTAATLSTITITPATPSVSKGATLNLVATGTFTDGTTQVLTNTVNWMSSAIGTATVSNAAGQHGRVTGVAAGTVIITATSTAATGSKVGTTMLTVTPPVVATIAVTPGNSTIAATHTLQFTATATLTDGTKQDISSTATWTSSMPTIATISTAGLATGVAAGTTQISAASGGVTSNKPTLTVTP